MKQDLFHYTSCGLRNVYLRNGYTVKRTAYGRAVAIQDVEGLHRVIGMQLAKNKPRLSGADIRFLRKELDMSQSLLARSLGVGETSVRNWESGRGKIGKPAERLLRLLYQDFAEGKPPVRELVERISQLNRDLHARKLEFEETRGGWRAAA